MTKLDKLRATVEAMTAAPWELWTSNSFRRITGPSGRDGGVLSGTVQRHDGQPDLAATPVDLSGIVALRNAAPALFAIVEAAQRYMAANDRQDVSGDAYIQISDACLALREAISSLEELLP